MTPGLAATRRGARLQGRTTVDELIQKVSERAGISGDQAKTAVNAVFDFLKDKLPMIGDRLKGLLGGGEEGGNPLSGLSEKLGGMFKG